MNEVICFHERLILNRKLSVNLFIGKSRLFVFKIKTKFVIFFVIIVSRIKKLFPRYRMKLSYGSVIFSNIILILHLLVESASFKKSNRSS